MARKGKLGQIRSIIIQHFINAKRGITYQQLADALGTTPQNASRDLDSLGDEDIEEGNPPTDALVVRNDTGIPAPEHFLYRTNYYHGSLQREYYFKTINQLATQHNVTLDEEWTKKVRSSLR